jgi:hypothetical protein
MRVPVETPMNYLAIFCHDRPRVSASRRCDQAFSSQGSVRLMTTDRFRNNATRHLNHALVQRYLLARELRKDSLDPWRILTWSHRATIAGAFCQIASMRREAPFLQVGSDGSLPYPGISRFANPGSILLAKATPAKTRPVHDSAKPNVILRCRVRRSWLAQA